jgi:hypothetical protein
VSTDNAPDLPAAALSRAAQQLAALAHPDRMDVIGAVLRLEQAGTCSLAALAADQRTDVRAVARHVAVLEAAGLVRVHEHRVLPLTHVLGETSEALLAGVPVVALLREEPDLERFFSFGRLTRVPLLSRVDERRRLAGLVVRLLPADRSLTEAEVNRVLAGVMDDVAALRRFLVEEGRLTRRGSQDYRRVDG